MITCVWIHCVLDCDAGVAMVSMVEAVGTEGVVGKHDVRAMCSDRLTTSPRNSRLASRCPSGYGSMTRFLTPITDAASCCSRRRISTMRSEVISSSLLPLLPSCIRRKRFRSLAPPTLQLCLRRQSRRHQGVHRSPLRVLVFRRNAPISPPTAFRCVFIA